jgi:hypothetical protein
MATPNNPAQSGYAYLFKCSSLACSFQLSRITDIIIGDTGVGKSCLLLQFTDKVCGSRRVVDGGADFLGRGFNRSMT